MRNKKITNLVPAIAVTITAIFWANFAYAETNSVIISEALINGPNGIEFIELYNPTNEAIDMSSWVLNYYSKDRDWNSPYRKKFFPVDSVLGPNEFFLISIKTGEYSEESAWNLGYSSYQLNNTDGALVIFPDENFFKENALDVLSWGKTKVDLFEELSAPTDKSLEKIDLLAENEKENWQESCEDGGTPGENPEICKEKPDFPEKAYSKNIKLSELLPNPSNDEDSNEFTELYNADPEETTELSGWTLEDKAGNSYSLPDMSISPGEYLAFHRNSSAFSLNNTGEETVFLKNPLGEIVDRASYSETVKEGFAYALSDEYFQWTSTPTPGERNVFDSPVIEASVEDSIETSMDSNNETNASEKVFLNEILPNPKGDEEKEFIEIVNGDSKSVDLFGWTIRDGSKTGKYVFKDHTQIANGEYLAIYRSDSNITLNNSSESVTLYDPQGEITSSISYVKSLEGASYSFDGKKWPASNALRSNAGWKWSKYLTPGKKNKFDSQPSVKIAKPKRAYKGLLTEFDVKAKDKETKKLKYAWDFGDGKKSYLAKTTHKYQGTGKYTVTLSVMDDSQTVEKSFSLQVKKYPRPDIEIVRIVPNPTGKDSDGEIVDVKNNSKKKIDLAGWKIATGAGENIYNHPVIGEISLAPGETETINREICKFSLNNKAGRVSLVMPDSKVTDVVEYEKEKISENETYAKIDGEWQWIEADEKDGISNSENKAVDEDAPISENENTGVTLGATTENISFSSNYHSHFTSEDAYIFLSKIDFARTVKREMTYRPANNPSSNIAYLIASLI